MTTRTTIYLTDDMKQLTDTMASNINVSKSELYRKALLHYYLSVQYQNNIEMAEIEKQITEEIN